MFVISCDSQWGCNPYREGFAISWITTYLKFRFSIDVGSLYVLVGLNPSFVLLESRVEQKVGYHLTFRASLDFVLVMLA